MVSVTVERWRAPLAYSQGQWASRPTALGSRLAEGDICRRGSLGETWTGGQVSPAAAVGNCETGDQISTGALGEPPGFLQRPQSYPPTSEGDTDPNHPALTLSQHDSCTVCPLINRHFNHDG